MKKGKVISLAISHKNLKHIFQTGDPVKESDVNDFDKLVETGHIKPDLETSKNADELAGKAEKAKKDLLKKNTEAAAEKAKAAKEKTESVQPKKSE